MANRSFRRFLSVFITFLFLSTGLTFIDSISNTANAGGLSSCADAAGQTSNVTIASSHGNVFYIDSSSGQNLDSAYVGYRVTASAAKTNLWAKIDTFRGGYMSLVNQDDAIYSLGDISNGSTKAAYFYLKASATTKTAQTHVIHIYSGKPGLATSTEIRSCTYTFDKIQETIKANPNKISAISSTPSSTSNLSIGSTFDVTLTGDTGTIGAGSTPDGDIIWLTPAARSSWPTQALRLESSVVKFGSTANNANSCSTEGTCQFTNKLLIPNLLTLANNIQNNSKSLNYKATFTFRVIGQAASGVSVFPISQISSGTQVKHTPVPGTSLLNLGVNAVTVSATTTKSVATTSIVSGGNTEFTYTVKVANTGSSAITVDKIIDTPATGLTYVPSTVSLSTYSVATGGSATTSTPTAPNMPVGATDQEFAGPFSVPAGGRIELTYRMSIATCSTSTYSYSNAAKAFIGDIVIGSTATTVQSVAASGTCGNTSVTNTQTDSALPIEVITLPATSVANTSATLNGTVDPNGISGKAVKFQYGTTSDLSGADTTTVTLASATTSGTTPYSVSTTLSGLSTGTPYYFRVVADNVNGDILSFVTTEPVTTPTITTDAPTNVTSSGGILNGTIDPNQTASYVQFTFSKASATLASGTYVVRILDDPLVAYNASSNPYTVFSGAFPVQFSLDTADKAFTDAGLTLNANDTLYYRADYTDSAGTIISSGSIKSFKLTTYSTQTITFNAITDQVMTTGSLTLSPTTNATGLTVTLTSSTTDVCTVSGFDVTFLKAGDCTLVASQGGGVGTNGTYYSVATEVVRTFAITQVSQTVQFTSSAPVAAMYGGSTYSVTGSASSGLTPTITSATPSVCTVSGGVVTFVGAGTCTLNINQSGNNTYSAATQVQQSFSVDYADRTLTASTSGANNDVWGTPSRTVSSLASADDSDSKSYASADTTVCTVDSSGNLTLLKPGTCSLTATISQGNRYRSKTSNSVSFTIAKKDHTLSGMSDTTANASVASVSMAATSDSDSNRTGLATTTYAVSGTDPDTAGCSVNSSGTVTFTSAGECSIIATNTGNDYWKTANLKKKLTLNRVSRTLSATTTGANNDLWGTSGRTISSTATADDSDTKSYASADTSICTVDSSGNLTLLKPGTCTLTASIAQGNRYNSASASPLSFTIAKKSHSLSGSDTSANATVSNVSMAVTSSSNANNSDLASTVYSVESGTNTAGCTVNASTGLVTFTNAGECYINSSNSGNDYWESATTKKKLTLNRVNRTITASTSGVDQDPWGTADRTVSSVASADDGDSKTYASSTTTVCTVDSLTGELTLLKPGTCSLSATVAEGNRYNSATSSTVSFIVAKKAHTLSGMFDKSANVSATSISMAATSESDTNNSDLATTTYEITGTNTANCTVNSSGVVSFTTAGECSVKATNTGNTYWGTGTVTKKVTVNNKLDRSLTLSTTSLTTLTWGASGRSVSSSTVHDNSDIKTYSSDDTTVCTVDSSGNLTFLKPGHCVVTSSIAEGATYNSAISNSITFYVEHQDRSLTASTTGQNDDPWGTSGRTVSGLADQDNSDTKTYTSSTTAVCSVNSLGQLTLLKPGTCTLVVDIEQGNRYKAKTSDPVSFVVGKKPHSISGANASANASASSVSMSVTTDANSNNSGLASTSYSIESGTNTAGCSVNAATGEVTFTSAGECFIESTNAGNTYWGTANGKYKLTLNRVNRTVTAATTGVDQDAWGTTGRSVSATTANDNSDTKSYTSIDTTICTVDAAGQLTLVKPGTCRLTGKVHQGNKYNEATSSEVSFIVGKKDHTLTGYNTTTTLSQNSTSMAVTSDANSNTSGMALTTYAISSTDPNTANCTVDSAGLVSFTSAGECSVESTNTGNTYWKLGSTKKKLTVNAAAASTPTPTPTTSTPAPTTSATPTPTPTQSRRGGNPNPGPTRSVSPAPTPAVTSVPLPVPTPAGAIPTPVAKPIDIPTVATAPNARTNTINIDGKVVPATQAVGSGNVAVRTISELAAESLAGFTSRTGLAIEVIGAKTTGQFIITPGVKADPIALAAALAESSARTATNFARINTVTAVIQPDNEKIIGGVANKDAIEVFKSSSLENPITVGQLPLTSDTKWVKIDATITTYKPGSVVYLAVTSQPVIFGAAVVDKYGQADLSGYLPVSALPGGGHNIRIVGLRELEGVSTDADGEIILAESTLSEIQRFDEGTKSTVKVAGANASGGINLVVREIPLSKFKPWWTIWFVSWTGLLLLIARRAAKIVTKREQIVGSGVMIVSALPALVLGWVTATYEIMGIGSLIGLAGVLLIKFVRPKKDRSARANQGTTGQGIPGN